MQEQSHPLPLTSNLSVRSYLSHATWPLAGAVGVGTAASVWLVTASLGANQSYAYTSVGMAIGGLIAGAATARRLKAVHQLSLPQRYAILIAWSLAAAGACSIGLVAADYFAETGYLEFPNTPVGGAIGGLFGCTVGGLVTVICLPRKSLGRIRRLAALLAWSVGGLVGGYLTMMFGSSLAVYSLMLFGVGWIINWALWGALGGLIAGTVAMALLSLKSE